MTRLRTKWAGEKKWRPLICWIRCRPSKEARQHLHTLMEEDTIPRAPQDLGDPPAPQAPLVSQDSRDRAERTVNLVLLVIQAREDSPAPQDLPGWTVMRACPVTQVPPVPLVPLVTLDPPESMEGLE